MENVEYGKNLPENEKMKDDFGNTVAIECHVM
jgi:hypothetical protein